MVPHKYVNMTGSGLATGRLSPLANSFVNVPAVTRASRSCRASFLNSPIPTSLLSLRHFPDLGGDHDATTKIGRFERGDGRWVN